MMGIGGSSACCSSPSTS